MMEIMMPDVVSKKYKAKPGDLLYAPKNETFGIIHKETVKKIYYYALGQDGVGGPYIIDKKELYSHIDNGKCVHQLGKTKYRRERRSTENDDAAR